MTIKNISNMIAFISESNRIEGIHRPPTDAEIAAHASLLETPSGPFGTHTMKKFVSVIAPGKPLRNRVGMDVRVGNHIAPPGGPEITMCLSRILIRACEFGDPYLVHQDYEHLHPFMDGNGRSGRALWLWMMKEAGLLDRALAIGFLHNWYYASLSHHKSGGV